MHPPGETLRRIRLELGLSLSSASRRSRLPTARLEQLERGDDPWFLEAVALADAYNLTIEELAYTMFGDQASSPRGGAAPPTADPAASNERDEK